MRVSLIVPAAGLGSRFQQSLPDGGKKYRSCSKLLYELGGEPVLLRTLRVFSRLPQIREVVVAVNFEMKREIPHWPKRVGKVPIKWIMGGETRAASVLKALGRVSSRSEWVMVHDGARPLVSESAIRKVVQAAAGWDGAILARRVVPTIKKVLTVDGRIQETVDRNTLYEAETPQLVRRELLIRAYRQIPDALAATDEAGLLEKIGAKVRVVPHDGWNPKLTVRQDLLMAKAMIEKNDASEVRVGIGFDTHRLVPGRKFYLGGIVIPSPKGPLGHSDGDALLHALADAVLGAIGAGDIGEWFSDRDPKFKGMRSTLILKAVLEEARKQGWEPYQADTNIILETPKLYQYKLRIKKSVAKCFGLAEKDISIKARTREGLGPEGEGLAVTCEAVVCLRKVPA